MDLLQAPRSERELQCFIRGLDGVASIWFLKVNFTWVNTTTSKKKGALRTNFGTHYKETALTPSKNQVNSVDSKSRTWFWFIYFHIKTQGLPSTKMSCSVRESNSMRVRRSDVGVRRGSFKLNEALRRFPLQDFGNNANMSDSCLPVGDSVPCPHYEDFIWIQSMSIFVWADAFPCRPFSVYHDRKVPLLHSLPAFASQAKSSGSACVDV